MKLYYHYNPSGFSNCYLLAADNSAEEPHKQSEAIIIDPGMLDSNILSAIEENNYTLRAVLITHDHPHHVRGLRVIQRIYNVEILAINPVVAGHRTTLVKDGELINAGSFKIEAFSIPGHSADSAVYRIDRLIFTGDTMSAGLVGNTASSYSAATQISALRRKIFSLPGDYTILPGHGPPSSMEAERRFNFAINSFEQQKNRRPAFRVEL